MIIFRRFKLFSTVLSYPNILRVLMEGAWDLLFENNLIEITSGERKRWIAIYFKPKKRHCNGFDTVKRKQLYN